MYKKIALVLTLLASTLIALSTTSLAEYYASGTGYHIANQFVDPEPCIGANSVRLVGFRGNAYQISTGAYHFAWIQGLCEDRSTTNPVGLVPNNTNYLTAPSGTCPAGFYPNAVDGYYTAYGVGAFEFGCLNPKTGVQQGVFHFGTDTQGSYNGGRCAQNDVMHGFRAWLAATTSNPPGNLQTVAITEFDLTCITNAS